MKHFIYKLFPFLLKIRARVTYDRAVRKADELFASTGTRQYIIKGANRTLLIVDRDSFRKLKRKRYINGNAHVIDLEQYSCYHTPYLNGTGKMSDKEIISRREKAVKWLANR